MQPSSAPRWELIADMVGPAASVLDIGCRDMELRSHLPSGARYIGLDLGPPADVIASAEEPLPFADDEFEVAVLADVLEHLNHPHQALREAIRVSSAGVVLLLPNMFFYRFRIAMLRGRLGTDKYEMGPLEKVDRHRWFPHIDGAQAFTRGIAAEAGWRVTDERAHDGGSQRLASKVASGVLKRMSSPAAWAYEYAARIGPESGA